MKGAFLAAAALAALSSAGCATMARLNIYVQLDAEQIKETGTIPTVEVNIIGVNEAELPQWQSYSVDQYWAADDKLRKGADKVVLKFGETNKTRQLVRDDSAVWDTWEEKTAMHLFILADIPGLAGGGEGGGKDGRLLVLPLSPDAWSGDEVTITIKSGGITCMPSPRTTK